MHATLIAALALGSPALLADDYAAWQHHGTINILTTPDGANLPASASIDGFPLLVRLNSDFLDFAQCKANGDDIRFSAADGAPLAYRIEEWNPASGSATTIGSAAGSGSATTNGSATLWVRIPHIAGNARQELRIHWGNANAAPASDGKAVFNESNGFCSVWHMNEPVADDTGSVESKDERTSSTRGIVGDARHLAGGQGVFAGSDIATYPKVMGPMSTSAWFRAERVNGTVVGWGQEKRPAKVMMNFLSPPRVAIQCYFADVEAQSTLATGEWYHVVHTYSPKNSRVYINGVLDGASTPELNIPETSALWIGGWHGNYNFVGDVDEVRIASVARSADWIRLEYENQKPMQTAVGPIVAEGARAGAHASDAFALSDAKITIKEGAQATVTARANGAQKITWTFTRGGRETVVATDRLSCTIDAGRVSGDELATLACTAVFADGVQTKSVAVKIAEAVADPKFELVAPASWDGRKPIKIEPRVGNLAALKAQSAGELRVQWTTGPMAVRKEIDAASGDSAGALRLSRALNSGTLTVTATIDNGGAPITKSATIAVREPVRGAGQDAVPDAVPDTWMQRTPGADEKPEENAFYARDDKNEATLVYNGVLADAAGAVPGAINGVFLRVLADGKPFAEKRANLTADRRYALSATLKPGLVHYTVEFGTISTAKYGAHDTVIDTVRNIVCGDAYIIEGQSNAVATDWGEGKFDDSNEWIRSFGATGGNPGSVRWGNAVRRGKDDQLSIGYWGYDLAQHIVDTHHVPICIINGAVGGTRVDQHQRDEANPENHDTIHGRLLWRVHQARLENGIRGVIWHQGENDQGSDGPAGGFGFETYRAYFLEMVAAWKLAFPNIQHYYIFQIWPKSCAMGRDDSDDRLREVQRTLARAFSNMSVMSTLGIEPPGGCHYPAAGYAQFAKLIAPLVDRDNYAVTPTTSITPPNLVRAYFASDSAGDAQMKIVLEFDQPVAWRSACESEIYLDAQPAEIASSSGDGRVVRLMLKSATNARTIKYLDSDHWSQERILRGENNIAALTFCDVEIERASKPPRP